MQRILFVVNVDWFFLSHRLPVALAARDAGFEVHVATALTGPSEAVERYGFKFHELNIDRKSAGPLQAIKVVWELRSLIKNLKPSIVHLVTIKPVVLGGLAARLAGVPRVVAAISGLGYIFTASGFTAALRRSCVSALYRLALARPGVCVIFQNGDDQALLQHHAAIKSEQVVRIRGSGVDLSAWPLYPYPEDPPIVLMASRLLVDKGVGEFLQAARILHGYKSVRFVLVGDIDAGNPTSLSRTQIQAWVDEGTIEWWGQRKDMPQVLGMAHVVVLPSYREGFPKVLIEAAASGRAVVTTNVPGCRDAIEPGRTGLLVDVRNVTALAQAIQTLLDNPEQMRAMGAAGRRFAESAFDVREVIARHLAIYRGS
jgi:glycosyltransferase involved in cell wall biosynthesis